MSSLPAGWALATLNDTGEYINGMAFKPSDWVGDGLPIIRIQNLTDHERQLNRTLRRVEDRYLVDDGDILVSWSATLDAFIWNRGRAVLNQHIFKVVPDTMLLDRGFLYYGLRTKIREMIESEHLHGSTMRHINRGPFLSHSFAIPPLAEQRRIVAKIESLFTKTRLARDELGRLLRLVEKYKQAILASAFRGDLTREWRAAHFHNYLWDAKSLGELLTDIRYGTAKKCDYDGGTTGVLRIPNVQHGCITLDDIKSADFSQSELEALRLDNGDILVIRSNGSLDLVGRSAVVEGAAVGMLFAGYLIRLRVDRALANPTFIQLYLQTAETRARLERLAKSTSGVNNVNSTQLKSLPLALPNIDEQQEIVRVVEAAFGWIDRLTSEAASARKLIDHLGQAILAKAFQGELVPQDPRDEPASALLERIRTERATRLRTGTKRTRRLR